MVYLRNKKYEVKLAIQFMKYYSEKLKKLQSLTMEGQRNHKDLAIHKYIRLLTCKPKYVSLDQKERKQRYFSFQQKSVVF